MSKILIENNLIKLEIDTVKCVFSSIHLKKNDMELLFQGDEKSWMGKDICVFPFVARLKNSSYEVDGKVYSMRIHGLCDYNEFSVEEITTNKIVLSFCYNKETLKEYPYKFKIESTFSLLENTIKVTYKVFNLQDSTMFFGIGGHPSFFVDGFSTATATDISGNTLDFGKEYQHIRIDCKDGLYPQREANYGTFKTLNLDKSLFIDDAIILKNQYDSISLLRKNGIKIKVGSDSDYMGIWTHKTFGDYVCIEPWWSLPDFEDAPNEFSKKKTLQSLEEGMSKEYSYTIEID